MSGLNIAFAVITCIGLLVVWRGIVKMYNASKSKSWMTVGGVIDTSEAKEEVSTSYHEDENGVRHEIKHMYYYFRVLFSYEVDGQKYYGNKHKFGTRKSSPRLNTFQPLIDKYPVGSAVVVYVHPNKPKLSVLEPGINYDSCRLFILGLSILFLVVTFKYIIPNMPSIPHFYL